MDWTGQHTLRGTMHRPSEEPLPGPEPEKGQRRWQLRAPVPAGVYVSCDASFFSRTPITCKDVRPLDVGAGGIALRVSALERNLQADLPVKLRIRWSEEHLELDGIVRNVHGVLRRRVGIRFLRNDHYERHAAGLDDLVRQCLRAKAP